MAEEPWPRRPSSPSLRPTSDSTRSPSANESRSPVTRRTPNQLPPGPPLVEAAGVVKNYGSVRALADLRLRVFPGEVYGLLGPNGAGKTTTLRILSALEVPTSGSVRVVGFDPVSQKVEVKRATGYVAETAVLYESLTPREYFEFVASTRELDPSVRERVSRLASVFDIGGSLDVPVGALSLGTKQKISVIAALMHKPPLLLLDEPLNGLDAKSSRILKELDRAARGGRWGGNLLDPRHGGGGGDVHEDRNHRPRYDRRRGHDGGAQRPSRAARGSRSRTSSSRSRTRRASSPTRWRG